MTTVALKVFATALALMLLAGVIGSYVEHTRWERVERAARFGVKAFLLCAFVALLVVVWSF